MTSISWNEFFTVFNDSKPNTVIAYGSVFPESPTKPDVVQASVDYFIALTQNLGQDVTVVTCDQAIYDIVKGFTTKYTEKYKNLIVRLGGFHIVVDFLGAVGNIVGLMILWCKVECACQVLQIRCSVGKITIEW